MICDAQKVSSVDDVDKRLGQEHLEDGLRKLVMPSIGQPDLIRSLTLVSYFHTQRTRDRSVLKRHCWLCNG